jgi:hypothetical protein
MPVVDSAGGYASYVGSGFAHDGETTLEFADAIGLAEGGEVGAGAGLAVGGLKGVDLLEEIKVALVASFEGLISLFPTEHLDGALMKGVSERKERKKGWNGRDLS